MAKTVGDSGLTDVWASSGNVGEPDLSKKDQGWVIDERPPHEFMNWLQRRFGEQMNHVMQWGVPLWNAYDEYQIGSVVNSGGALWQAVAVNTNSTPSDVNPNWDRVGIDFPVTDFAKTLLDDADAATARGTLGLGSAAERAAEDTLTDGANLPDGAAVIGYVQGQITNLSLGTAAQRNAEDTLTDGANLPDGAAVTAAIAAAVMPAPGAVGGFVWARGVSNVTFGGTEAGSNLTPTSAYQGLPTDAQGQVFPVGAPLSGTWRCLGEYTHTFSNLGNNDGATLWQRIA